MTRFIHRLSKVIKNNRFSRTDILVCVILSLGIFLRVWRLEHTMIFFADAGRDMMVSVEMAKEGIIPLLGIPSSEPRFKQGPLFIWLMATVFFLFGFHPLYAGFAFSFLNCIALLGCYWLVKKHVSVFAALMTTVLLATSPLAVAHSRMPYHITPIISFFLIYLWSLQRLADKKREGVFVASFSWALLFQFELALLPMIMLIFFTLWKKKIYQRSIFWQLPGGLVLGLLPQIIFDLTHQFAQLGGFAKWTGLRLLAFFVPGRAHTFSFDQLHITWMNFSTFFSRIFSLDHPWVGLVMLIVMFMSGTVLYLHAKRSLFIEHVLLSLGLLLISFVIHGSPSEAYFPPVILLSCIVIGCGLSVMNRKSRIFLTTALAILALYNSIDIVKNNFFTLPARTEFQYGLGYYDQLQVMRFIETTAQRHPYNLRSTDPEARFETYLDNYRVIGKLIQQEGGKSIDSTLPEKTFIINKPHSEVLEYPQAKVTFFNYVDVIEIPTDL